MTLDHTLCGKNIGCGADMGRKVDAGSDRPQGSCYLIYFLKFGVDFFEIFGSSFELFLERSGVRCDGDALSLCIEVG